ncbi:MAG: hypothetical protein ACK55R_00425 [Cyanobacteriota bacterium]
MISKTCLACQTKRERPPRAVLSIASVHGGAEQCLTGALTCGSNRRLYLMKKSNWAIHAIENVEVDFAVNSATPLPLERSLADWRLEATVTSYDCCSTTQTKGPGCCQIDQEDNKILAIWPIVMPEHAKLAP